MVYTDPPLDLLGEAPESEVNVSKGCTGSSYGVTSHRNLDFVELGCVYIQIIASNCGSACRRAANK